MKSQEITPEIKKAIWDWYQKEKLTQPQIAELLGIKNSSVNHWLNGISKTIRPHNWENLYPYIKKYLPQEYKTSGNNSPVVNGNGSVGVNHGTINLCQAEIESFRKKAIDAIIKSALDEKSKILVYNIITDIPAEK